MASFLSTRCNQGRRQQCVSVVSDGVARRLIKQRVVVQDTLLELDWNVPFLRKYSLFHLIFTIQNLNPKLFPQLHNVPCSPMKQASISVDNCYAKGTWLPPPSMIPVCLSIYVFVITCLNQHSFSHFWHMWPNRSVAVLVLHKTK